MALALVESRSINGIMFDGFYGENEAWFTRQQIGAGLEYADPQDAIDKIHRRHKERLDKFSVPVSLSATDGKTYKTNLYNTKGVLEICRWSRQPKADLVMDALYDMAMEVQRKGYFSVISEEELYEQLGKRLNGQQELVLREYTPVHPYSTVISAIPLATVSEKIVCGR